MAITGTVKFFNADKGYGFIAPETGGQDAFVHISAVERSGLQTLNQNQRVSYELETDQRGKTSVAGKCKQRCENMVCSFWIKITCWLISQKKIWRVSNSTRNSHPLLFSARQLKRPMRSACSEFHIIE